MYGCALIESFGKSELKSDGPMRKVTIHIMQVGKGTVRAEDIFRYPAFSNFDRQKWMNVTSVNEEQARILNAICRQTGAAPPDPQEEDLSQGLPPMRPIVTEFVLGQKLLFDETRFDEFKSITSPDVVARICDEVYGYVIGFLNLEDRRDTTECRIFWGITDKTRMVEGVKLNDGDRDKLRRDVSNKLSRIQPPLASSARYIEIHQVKDLSGAPIQNRFVVEVGVGHGATGEFYCSENGTFYIKGDGVNEKLSGQPLVAEIRRRVRSELIKAMKEIV
jgi:hypothetical protein